MNMNDMDIKPTHVTFEQAKKLKKKGFDVNGSHYMSLPEQSMVIEWLRVNYGIWVTIGYLGDGYNCTIQNKKGWTKKAMGNFNSPQKATSAAIDYVLEKLI